MRTGVQLRLAAGDGLPRSELLAGVPCEVVSGAMGPVALFRPGEIVAYLLRGRRRGRLFVFRTLDVDDRLAASVPGVRPRVQLLLELHTAGRIRRGRDLFAYLGRTGRDPSGLADPLYVRVSAVLGGRLPAHTILVSLLAQATSVPAVGDPGPPELALRLHLHERSGSPHAEDTASAEGKRSWNTRRAQP